MLKKVKNQSATLETLSTKIDALAENLDDLARIAKLNFDSINRRLGEADKHFEKLDFIESRIDHVEAQLDHMNARLGMLERDTATIRDNIVRRDTFDDIVARLEFLEKKMGVKSS